MIKNLKKKKAFTLVEVIIVLAIIAIIAAIAIPNLTKVRKESKIKADTQSCETIRRTVLTLITEDTIKVNTSKNIDFDFKYTEGENDAKKDTGKVTGIEQTLDCIAPGKDQDYVEGYFKDIKAPQADGKVDYYVTIKTDGEVVVETKSGTDQ